MTRTPFFALAALALMTPTGLSAEQAYELDEIVLSGGLTALAADSYARSYTVLTADDIETRGIATVQDALRDVPGVQVASSGDTMAQVRVRGSEYSHVLVLIDGVEANSPGNGDYVFRGMDMADIDRIEILRGPQSTIYGPNAAAGVIAITTKGASKPGLSYGGGVEVGGLKTRAANAYLRHQGARGAISLSLSSRHIGGEDISREGGGTAFNDIDTIGLKGEYDLTDALALGFTLRRSWQEYAYGSERYDDGWNIIPVEDPRDYLVDLGLTSKRREGFAALWLEGAGFDGRLHSRLAYSGTRQDMDHFDRGTPNGDDRSTRRALTYTGSYALDGGDAAQASQKLNLIAGTERETYRASLTGGGKYQRDTHALGLEYQGRYAGGIDVQAGIRRDFNDVFKDANSWNLSFGWTLPDRGLRLRAAAGKANVNPDMFQQYGFLPGAYRGNPDLKPESSLNYEIGADLDLADGRGNAGLTVFQSRVKDMITSAGDSSANLAGTSTRKGVEAFGQMQVTERLLVGADYTYLDAHDQNGAPIRRAPRHHLGLRATTDFAQGRGAISGNLRHASGSYDAERFNGTDAITRLPAYTTVDLAVHYDLNDQTRLSGRVINLFDREYTQAWGYYGQGRTVYVGLEAKW